MTRILMELGKLSYEEAEREEAFMLTEARLRNVKRQVQGYCLHCAKPHNGRQINGWYYCKKHYPTRNRT